VKRARGENTWGGAPWKNSLMQGTLVKRNTKNKKIKDLFALSKVSKGFLFIISIRVAVMPNNPNRNFSVRRTVLRPPNSFFYKHNGRNFFVDLRNQSFPIWVDEQENVSYYDNGSETIYFLSRDYRYFYTKTGELCYLDLSDQLYIRNRQGQFIPYHENRIIQDFGRFLHSFLKKVHGLLETEKSISSTLLIFTLGVVFSVLLIYF
jgi:hypothetical protein